MSFVLLSMRRHYDRPGFGAFFEFEDAFVRATGASLLELPVCHRSGYERAQRFARRARLPNPARSARPIATVSEGVEFALLTSPNLYDLRLLDRVDGLATAKCVAAYLPEVWPGHLPPQVEGARPERLDAVFTSIASATELLRDRLGVDAHYLPLGIDVLRFLPHEDFERPIRVTNLGRRDGGVHSHLLERADAEQWTYWFDTTSSPSVSDYRGHRQQLANLMAMTSTAIANYAKFDQPITTAGVREISTRHLECLAAGAHIVGARPDETILAMAGLSEIEMENAAIGTGEDVMRAISVAEERGNVARRAGVASAARSHDWSHRAAAMLRSAGLGVPASLLEHQQVVFQHVSALL